MKFSTESRSVITSVSYVIFRLLCRGESDSTYIDFRESLNGCGQVVVACAILSCLIM